MFTPGEKWSIAGHEGAPVPNQFLRHEGGAEELAIFLPGLGYTCDMPLFYYAQNLLEERGFDLLRVEYDYRGDAAFRAQLVAERYHRLFADATAAYWAARALGSYSRVTLIGKSLGTLAMSHLLTLEELTEVEMRLVWLTPLLHREIVREQIRRHEARSLVIIGTSDPVYAVARLDEIEAPTLAVEGAEHGMDIPGDVPGSIDAMRRVAFALQQFLAV